MEDLRNIFAAGARRKPAQTQGRTSIDAPEGIYNQQSGNPAIDIDRAVSRTRIRVSDLLCEGEIQGLVTGYYRYTSESGVTGYNSAEFVRNSGVDVNGVTRYDLQSIYFNEMPIVDGDGLFNFQQFDFVIENGSPLAKVVDLNSEYSDIYNPDENGLSIVRPINERLRGPNSTIDEKGKTRINDSVFKEAEIGDPETFAKYYRILNPLCKSATLNIRIGSLYEVNRTGPQTIPPDAPAGQGYGDRMSTSVKIKIFYRPIFNQSDSVLGQANQSYSLATTHTIEGKILNGYIQEIPFAFDVDDSIKSDPNFMGYELKIVRYTPDSVDTDLSNTTQIDSLIEYYSDQFGYPNSVIASSKFNAEYFNNVPDRAFLTDLLKVKIPSNYDPILRSYDGEWDGTFKATKEWTDNPAWCFYDLLTNKRYGLGKYIDSSLVDKWGLYQIAQYCDVMVPDGYGGYEPRFSCNMLIADKIDAYRAIQDFASVFRGITYYAGGTIRANQDSQKDPLCIFSNSNVIDGQFSYQSSSQKARFNSVIVRYNDKNDFYRPAVEIVEEVDYIRRNGIIQKEVIAVAATSKSQAVRMAKAIILSDNLETETISFSVGLEGALLLPGDVFQVQDNKRTQKRFGGRIHDIVDDGAKLAVTLDSYIPFSGAENYTFSLYTPTHNLSANDISDFSSDDLSGVQKSAVQSFDFVGSYASGATGSDDLVRTVITGLSNLIDFQSFDSSGNYVFSINSNGSIDKNEDELYRVLSSKEEDPGRYSIEGLVYKEEKYQNADNSLAYINNQQFAVPDPPDSITLSVNNITEEDSRFKKINYIIESDYEDTSSYIVYAKKGDWADGDFSQRGGTVVDATPDSRYIIDFIPFALSVEREYIPFTDGTYYFRVYSRNKNGVPSATPAAGQITVDQGDLIKNLTISNLSLSNNRQDNNEDPKKISDSYTVLNPSFSWDIGFKQLQATVDTSSIFFRVSIREPSDNEIPSNVIYFEQTGIPFATQENGYTYTLDYGKNFSGSAVLGNSARPFSAYADYYFPREDQSEFLKENFSLKKGSSGPFRNYDVVIEAHDADGNSSVGYNIANGNEGVGNSSVYAAAGVNSQGYDIISVKNLLPNQVIPTPYNHFEECRAAIQVDANNSFKKPYSSLTTSNLAKVYDDFDLNYPTATSLGANDNEPTYFCTEQFLEQNGNIVFKVFRDEQQETDPSLMNGLLDVAGGVVYYSDRWFDSSLAKAATYTADSYGVLKASVTSQRPSEKGEFPDFGTTTEIVADVYKVSFLVDTNNFKANGYMDIAANIFAAKKYCSFSFIDSFELNQFEQDLSTKDQLIANSKNYEASPTVLVLRKGDPDPRTGFRAFLKLVGSSTYNQEGRVNFGYTRADVMYHNTFSFEVFSYGIEDDIVVSSNYSAAEFAGEKMSIESNYLQPSFIIEATLTEPVPYQARVEFGAKSLPSLDNQLKIWADAGAPMFEGGRYSDGSNIFTNFTYSSKKYYYTSSYGSRVYTNTYEVQAIGPTLYLNVNSIVRRDLLTYGMLWNGEKAGTSVNIIEDATINTLKDDKFIPYV